MFLDIFKRNMPTDKFEQFSLLVEEKEETVRDFVCRPVQTAEEAKEAAEMAASVQTLLKEVSKQRIEDGKPYYDMHKAITAKYRALEDSLQQCKNSVFAALKPYDDRLRAEALAEKKWKWEEAERLRREAEAARQAAEMQAQNVRDETGAQEWQSMNAAAANADQRADMLELEARKAKPINYGDTGAPKVRSVKIRTANILNYHEALLYYAENDKVKALINSLAQADARAGVCAAGCEIVETEKLSL